ncbi:MAG: 4Fe-4S binding protein [Methanosarcinales archaeon]|nr:4Fe-4S binding protein [Methanosarcinales archaeon]
MADYEKLVWNETICAGCGICERSCPSEPGAIVITEGKAVIDYSLCDACGICVKECPVKALSFDVLA